MSTGAAVLGVAVAFALGWLWGFARGRQVHVLRDPRDPTDLPAWPDPADPYDWQGKGGDA
jgi:hypothetical protein